MSEEKKVEAPKPPPGPPAPPPPKNPGFITFTVDGMEVVAKPGTNMIEAVKQVGVEIPYYCYHPRLSIAANCRMCLVESSLGPKLVPACQTSIAEGVAIKTTTDKVKAQQKSVMEFLLLNHPVDCSICDQAGECKLQDYYMRYDFKASRLSGGKVLRNKRKVLGDLVVIDQERCVLCTRCVRFMDEVAKAPQLGVFGRGSHEVVDVAPHYGKLESNYSGNIVDICPVGALLNRDFRFRARAWFLSATPSVCTGCSRGCNISADFMGQEVYRYRPRENEQINKSWMCDTGRMTYKQLNQDRVLQSAIGKGRARHVATRAEALKEAGLKLSAVLAELKVAVAPTLSNEDLLATLTFARDVLKVKSVYVTGRADGPADDFLMKADKNPNRQGLEWIAKGLGLTLEPYAALSKGLERGDIKHLFMAGHDVPEAAQLFASKAETLTTLVMVATNHSPIDAQASVLLGASSHVEDEGSFTQGDGITQRVRRAYPPRGDSQPAWKWAVDLAKELGGTLVAQSSREIFRSLSPAVAELSSFEWDNRVPINQTRPGIATMAAGSDGRPAGYREQGVPSVRGLTLQKAVGR